MDASICRDLPNIFSSFVDTFVDFSVSGGLFLPPPISDPAPPPDPLQTPPPLQTYYSAPDRLIAVGDIHGDLSKLKEALRLALLIDTSDKWIGGSTTVVQTGDVLDRGGDELKILYFLEKLKRESEKSGGKIITMNGNHEIMNVNGYFRCVAKEGLEEFKNWADWYTTGNKMKSLCLGLEKPKDPFKKLPRLIFQGNEQKEFYQAIKSRYAALRPNGPIAGRFLSENLTVIVVGGSVFVHGGVLQHHVNYGFEQINKEVRDWIRSGKRAPDYQTSDVAWLRKFSRENSQECKCSELEHVLATIPGAKRMIMGHTIQGNGINGICDNKGIRIDVGMSKGCRNGFPEVLEILGNSELRILSSNPCYDQKVGRFCLDNQDRNKGLELLVPERGPKQIEVNA